MEIKVLGPGCSRCKTTYQVIEKVIKENNLDVKLTKVDDLMEMMKYNIMTTPAVVVDEVVKMKGQVPTESDVKNFWESENAGSDMIQDFADWLVYGIFGLSAGTSLGTAVNFFFYDTVKILILLFFISVLMGIVNAYFPIERLRNYLVTHRMYGLQYLLAALFGAITPFCSCSSIPLFIGFVKGGIPLGVTFAFLITSPLVNEVAVAMFLGSFGLKVTLIYVVSGILLGVIGGFVLGRMRLAPYLSDWVKQIQAHSSAQADEWEKDHTTFIRRLPAIVRDAWRIVRGVLVYILIGIGIGAFMHGFVPEGFFEQYMSKDNWLAVPLSVLLAVPMYANAAGIVPVIEVFVAKGIPMGTAIAFMMAVVGLSLPEATLLKKVMTWRLIGIFFGTVAFFIILSGYLFNFIL